MIEEKINFIKIEDLKNKDFFKKKKGAKKTFEKNKYCRSNKKFECTNYDDINEFIYLKKGTKIYIDF
jgi:hypothetical protein